MPHPAALPTIGSYHYVPFGFDKKQVAYVSGHTKTGRVKVRAWNASRNRWMPNTRTLDAEALLGPVPKSAADLFQPPT